MSESIRPIDQSRANRIALGTLTGNDALITEALDEAHAEDKFLAVLAASTRSWMLAAVHYAGEQRTREALQAAIFDAQIEDDDG